MPPNNRMLVTANIEDICAHLRTLPLGAIAGLEGFCGSGKTTLGNLLGERVPMTVFHVDNFARKFDQPPTYVECLDVAGLRRALEGREQSRSSIVEGICLRDVFALVNLSPTIFLYLKSVGENGLWYDGLHLEDFEAGQFIPGD